MDSVSVGAGDDLEEQIIIATGQQQAEGTPSSEPSSVTSSPDSGAVYVYEYLPSMLNPNNRIWRSVAMLKPPTASAPDGVYVKTHSVVWVFTFSINALLNEVL